MAAVKFSKTLVEQIFGLNDQQKTPAEIAQILNLKKLQVSAILAHQSMSKMTDMESGQVSGSSQRAFGTGEEQVNLQPPPSYPSSDIPTQTGAAPTPLQIPKTDGEASGDLRPRVYVGDDRDYGDPLYWQPMDAEVVQNPHLMIMGESGSGKTYAAQCLMAELSQLGIPCIVFDYGQSFEVNSLEEPFKKHTPIREHLIGEDGLAINPLQVFPRDNHGPRTVASRVSDVFDAVYRLGDIQRKVLIDAILLAFERTGISDSEPDTWQKTPPPPGILLQVLEELSGNRDYQNYKNAVGVTARLTTFFMLNSFRAGGEAWSWDRLINNPEAKVNILQFRGLESKTLRVTVELLLWHLFFYLKSRGQGPLSLFCVLDEAHHISFREGGPVDSLLREARKFGLGIIFASQQPEDFTPAAYSNSASKLIFQTADPNLRISRFLSAKCTNYSSPERVGEIISILPQGQAFFITKNKGYIVSIADLKNRGTLWVQK